MKRSARHTFGNPFAAWADLAFKIGELSVASAQVIAHRTTRMAAAGPMPNASDRQEFTRMGQEKIEAATESAQAFAAHLTTMNLALGARALQQMASGTSAFLSLATSRSAGQFITRQATLTDALWRSAKTVNELSHSTAQLAGRSLHPIHARATANARRLGKR
jgi:hypothetical protein